MIKIERFKQWKARGRFLLAGLALVVAPIGTMILPGSAYAAGATCTWTGAGDGQLWSDASNWSGCSGAPQNGDNLAFDTTSLSNIADLINDISNLQVGSISFSGSGINLYDIHGNAFSLSGGITDTSLSGNLLATDGITLTADQTFTTTGDLNIHSTTFNIGAYNLTIDAGDSGFDIDIYSPIVGSGELNFNGISSSIYFLDASSPNFSGPITVNDGTLIINAYETNQLGTGNVTIADGATLQESINSNGTYSVANPITVIGNGANNTSYGAGALIVHGYSATGTVNFTGQITLLGNTTVGLVGANAGIAGTVNGCGYTISKATGASGTLSGNLVGSCAPTPGGGGSGSSGRSSSSSDPKAPDTGYGVPDHKNPIVLAIAGAVTVTGAGLTLLYRRPHLR